MLGTPDRVVLEGIEVGTKSPEPARVRQVIACPETTWVTIMRKAIGWLGVAIIVSVFVAGPVAYFEIGGHHTYIST